MSVFGGVFLALLVGGGIIIAAAVGLTPSLARSLYRRQLSAHEQDLGAVDSDAQLTPVGYVGPDTVTVHLSEFEGADWEFLQTFTAPVLAILRARASTSLAAVARYLVPSVYRQLASAPEIFEGAYTVLRSMEASVPGFQAADIRVTGNHLDEIWTLVRRPNPIPCRACGAAISGAFNDSCRACKLRCSGFEAGWRVLEIRRT
jgi:hypothetical protein